MNADKIGLIKYIILIMAISLLPLLDASFLFVLSMAAGGVEPDSEKYFLIIVLLLLIVVPFVYLSSLILITRFAIKRHWSKYLDYFFNNMSLNTLIFFLSIITICIYLFFNWFNGVWWLYLCLCVVPTYIIIYITNLCIFLTNVVKNLKNK